MIHWKPGKFLPFLMLGAVLALAGCNDAHISVDMDEGVPLSELKLDGAAPTKLVLASPDRVRVTEGSKLDIAVSGDRGAVDALRFSLKDGTLGISRRNDWHGNGTAMVNVTMPAPREIVLAGSGDVDAQALKGDAEVTIAGAGTVKIAAVDAGSLDVNVLGSGTLEGAGAARNLDLKIAGSGHAQTPGLKVGSADVKILGSGSGAFSSDGTVEAKIAGSGTVDVYGNAQCRINALGSGALNCRGGDSWQASGAAPSASASATALPQDGDAASPKG